MIIRAERQGDLGAIRRVVEAAFGRPAEADLVDGLTREGDALVSLVAEIDGRIGGHVLFSRLGSDRALALAQLAPLAVDPPLQRHGIGAALARAGLDACRELGLDGVVVLGHPDYYPRFGFGAQAATGLISPFAGNPAYMALALDPGVILAGEARLAPAFDRMECRYSCASM
jgi:putative acetyltransferase